MTESGVTAVLAAISAAVLKALGVDVYVLVVAAVGAVAFQAWSLERASRYVAMLQVAVGAVIGAVAGQVAFEVLQKFIPGFESRAGLMLAAAFCGWSYQQVFHSLTKRTDSIVGKAVDKIGGGK